MQHLLNFQQLMRHQTNALDIAFLADHQGRTRIGDLVTQKIAAQCRVDWHMHRAQLIDRKPGDNCIDVVVKHRDDGLTSLNAQCSQGIGQMGRELINLIICVQFSRKIEQNPIGMRHHSAFECGDYSVLFTKRP